ncbi:MAG: KpsF/GutQ family sugar-phosphate isomerase [Alphaproteobacteria bacterium]|nr:KpsF/GutQ family sugar-phosphate isomerase [Alphaproteobacteria bacterium]
MTAKAEMSNTMVEGAVELDIQRAVHVLTTEGLALKALADMIDGSFSKAVNAIDMMKNEEQMSGRLIVAGIGKSGHVARKIAATMASTGTPSYFVHPGEASHGDMGMITKKDVVLMLSNSGENAELSDLIHYTRRYNITLIAVTGKSESTLAHHSDICLLLPSVGEVCPNGLAPTTSTTMMMAMGDALAIALLERMGLTLEQYKVFHPGGKLGQKLMSVADLMISGDDLPRVDISARMDEALLALTGKNIGCVLVFDGEELAGIVTDGDLKRHMSPDLLQKSVSEIMSKKPKAIEKDVMAVRAVDIMTQTPGKYVTSLIVCDGDKTCGLIRLQDCLQAGVA